MKKIDSTSSLRVFVKPVADVKAMEVETLLNAASTMGTSSTPVGGTEENHFKAGAKVGGASFNPNKMDF